MHRRLLANSVPMRAPANVVQTEARVSAFRHHHVEVRGRHTRAARATYAPAPVPRRRALLAKRLVFLRRAEAEQPQAVPARSSRSPETPAGSSAHVQRKLQL